MFDESKHPRDETGKFTEKSSDGFGGEHEASNAERARLKRIGIDSDSPKQSFIRLPKQEYAELCGAIRTKYTDRIPFKGQILYGDHYYRFKYNKRQEKIVCISKLSIAGNEDKIATYLEEN